MDAVILAGAKNDGALRSVSNSPYEADIPLAGRPLLDYAVQPLTGVRGVERIVVVGPGEILSADLRDKVWRIVPCGASMVENLRLGLAALATKEKVLLLTADLPLLTAEAIEDFLERCRAREADVYYPIVERGPIEQRFPGVRRTYATLREGTFTGGNIVLLAPDAVTKHFATIERAVALRKSPLQLARLLGLVFLGKLLIGRLSIGEVEQRIEKKLGLRGAAVVTPYAEIGIDVDKPSDLALVQQVLATQAGMGSV